MRVENPLPNDCFDPAWGEILLQRMGTAVPDFKSYISAEPRAALNACWAAIAQSEAALRAVGIMPQIDPPPRPGGTLELGRGVTFIKESHLDPGNQVRAVAFLALAIDATCRGLAEHVRPGAPGGRDELTLAVLNQEIPPIPIPPPPLGVPIFLIASVVAIGTAAACAIAFVAGPQVVALETNRCRILSRERIQLAIAGQEIAAGRQPTILPEDEGIARYSSFAEVAIPTAAGVAVAVAVVLTASKFLGK